jgi:hypothetical protein
MNISSFLKPDFVACPCCCSYSMHKRVGDQECFIPHATMAIARGEKAAHIRLNPTAANIPRLSL